ncbi:MAG: YncE family protein [Euryarchaeota archaeon]|nr:YncE family protein [Euryarchaeota archaeon]MDE1838103.1 YncE family protein [Euryarchaeota archaeon]MDE2046592.1 YncE family protein [Thermoplasmata archaeon]
MQLVAALAVLLAATLALPLLPVHASPVGAEAPEGFSNSAPAVTTRVFATGAQVIANVAVGSNPVGIAYDPIDADVYSASLLDQNVSAVSTTTDRSVAGIGVPTYPTSMTYDPVHEEIWTDGIASDCICAIVDSSNTLGAQVAAQNVPNGPLVADTNNGNIYAVINSGNPKTLDIVAPSLSSVVATLPLSSWGGWPGNIVYDPTGREVFVGMGSVIEAFNTTFNRAVANISLGAGGGTMAVDPLNGDLLVPVGSDQVAVISPTTNSILGNITVGSGPGAVAFNSTSGQVYVSNINSRNVSILSISSMRTTGSVPVGSEPDYMAYNPSDGDVYVSDTGSGSVTIFSGGSGALLQNLTTGGQPKAAAVASNGNVFVLLIGSIAVISGSPNGLNEVSSVSVSPSPASVGTTGSQVFTATPTCTQGSCPSGIAYSWSVTNSQGSLTPTTGPTATFTAGATAGQDVLFVNATLNGLSSMSAPVPITITASSPTLSSVSVNPTSGSVGPGGTQTFTATPQCTGGGCPTGATYAWTWTNSLGSVSPTTGPTVTFTAGSGAGTDTLFVNATLNGVTKQSSPVPVTISGSASSTLNSVSVSPPSDTLQIRNSVTLTATPLCTNTCPAGTTFSWSTTNSLGSLSATTGASVSFTAGSASGQDSLFVNATLNGVTQQSAPVPITITTSAVPALSSVAVSPTSTSLSPGGAQAFTATASCAGGPCPSGLTYVWTLSDSSLGSVSPTTGSTSTFTAGSNTGSETLAVTATLNGLSQTASVTITIGSSSTSGFLGLPGFEGYLLIAVVVAAVIVAAVMLVARRRKRRASTPQAIPQGGPQPYYPADQESYYQGYPGYDPSQGPPPGYPGYPPQ